MHIKQSLPSLDNTWVFVNFIDQVQNGSKKFVKLMNRDLVLWRTQSGTISLIDAYCPHMGTNLSYGNVKGETLECLLHKKCFTPNGKCVGGSIETPAYPIHIEHNMIFAWFGDKNPSWKIPSLLEGFQGNTDSKWKIFKFKKINYNFPPKYVGENSVDITHFKTFHNVCRTYDPVEIVAINDHRFSTKLKLHNTNKKLSQEIEFVITSIGPCIVIVDTLLTFPKREFFFKFIYLSSPIQGENTDFNLGLAILQQTQQASLWQKISRYFLYHIAHLHAFREFCKESKTIFIPKTNLVKQLLFKDENAIDQYNEWYSRFYEYRTEQS